MGTQTGTHIDAPAHFAEGGAPIDQLPVQSLMGQYLWLDLNAVNETKADEVQAIEHGKSILFLASSAQTETEISEALFQALLKLPCSVWVTVFGVRVLGRSPFYFHRALSEAGKYLIEDVDQKAAMQVNPGGELIALPLRLTGVSGSPCRVIVRQFVDKKF